MATKVKFNSKQWGKAVLKDMVEEQTKRLIAYADAELTQMVETHEYWNRTHNLEDSYVWGVFYNGKRQKYGFYYNKAATKESILHEWGRAETQVPVNGRRAAREFISQYAPEVTSGWEIVWAACAPYGTYLEAGFAIKKSGTRLQFDVITQRYDHIKSELEPKAKVHFEINFPK